MKIGLVGWGIETQSAYRYFGDSHNYLIVNEEPRDDFPEESNVAVRANSAMRAPGLTSNVADLGYLKGIEDCDVIVVSPTAKKTLEKTYTPDDLIWRKTTSNLQLFFENTPSQNIIGVTGTKGKGTTSTLISKLLEAGGKKVHLGGNIGLAALDLLPNIQKDDWIVLELSNFQLYNFPYSPHIAVHLMMMPEHIAEWHITMDDYINAKANICANQTKDDITIYLPTNEHSAKNAQKSLGAKIPYMQSPGAHIENDKIIIEEQIIVPVSEVALRGKHNLENICAALTAAWQVVQEPEAFAEVIRHFGGLEHRLQLVRLLEDVRYVDDSFGTTPDTTLVAVDAFSEPKVLIVGGHDKGNDMQPVIERLKQADIRSVIGIGPIGRHIVKELQKDVHDKDLHTKDDYNNWTMEEIVAKARSEAKPGDIVLLSAGTSSFGIFKDYKDRGNQFIDVVNKL